MDARTSYTLPDIAAMTGLPYHVIHHALRRHGPPPDGRIGITRVWHCDRLGHILDSIDRTQAIARRRRGESAS